jgi:hypothetical protein
MNMRYWWVIKSAIVGLVVLAAAYYLFSFASSIMVTEQKMIDQLSMYTDSASGYWSGYNDAMWLAIAGILITCIAGGMAATVLSRSDVHSEFGWVMASTIAVIFLILAADANIYLSWSNTLRMAQEGTLGRPIDPSPFIVILFIMLMFDGLCFLASVAGGFIARDKREMLIFKNNDK